MGFLDDVRRDRKAPSSQQNPAPKPGTRPPLTEAPHTPSAGDTIKVSTAEIGRRLDSQVLTLDEPSDVNDVLIGAPVGDPGTAAGTAPIPQDSASSPQSSEPQTIRTNPLPIPQAAPSDAPAIPSGPPPIPKKGPPPVPKAQSSASPAAMQLPSPAVPKKAPMDDLGVYALKERLRGMNLRSDEVALAANRFFNEDPRVTAFVQKHGDSLPRMVKEAESGMKMGMAPDKEHMLALHIRDLVLFIAECEAKAREYGAAKADIKQGILDPRSSDSFRLPGQYVDETEAGPSEKGSSEEHLRTSTEGLKKHLYFLTGPTTFGFIGIVVFGAALHATGAFQELSYGIDKLLRSFNSGALALPGDFLEKAYLISTSLVLLTTELARRISMRGKAAHYERLIRELPGDLPLAYSNVCKCLSSIARTYAHSADQLSALKKALEDESFFYMIDALNSHSYGEPLIAAITASGLNWKVPTLGAIEHAETKIMRPKIERLLEHIDNDETRRALFRAMYNSDAVFRKKSEELLTLDREDRFVNYKRFAFICKQIGQVAKDEAFIRRSIKALRKDFISTDITAGGRG